MRERVGEFDLERGGDAKRCFRLRPRAETCIVEVFMTFHDLSWCFYS